MSIVSIPSCDILLREEYGTLGMGMEGYGEEVVEFRGAGDVFVEDCKWFKRL